MIATERELEAYKYFAITGKMPPPSPIFSIQDYEEIHKAIENEKKILDKQLSVYKKFYDAKMKITNMKNNQWNKVKSSKV